VTLKISWSGLRTHEECKQRGHLQRQGKRATLDNQRIFFPGTVTDRVVRDWLVNEPLKHEGEMSAMVEEIVNREKAIIEDEGGVMSWKSREDKAKVIEDCVEAVTKIEPALMKYVVPFEYMADYRFKAPIDVPHPDGGTEQILLHGAMDILVKDGKGRYAVWDVKHTRDDGYWRKTVGQLGFYDLACQIMFDQPTSIVGLLQPLCKKEVLPVTLDENSRGQMMQRVVGMARDIWNKDVPPRSDNKLCGFCAVRHACSKFQPVRDIQGKDRVSF
jgi:CRISPR/Cas system-associated exonuclease Cas4 (RecB family)